MEFLAVFSPLIGAICTGLFTKKISGRFAEVLTSVLMVISAIASSYVFYDSVILKKSYVIHLFTWIDVGFFRVDWAINVDSLTAIMMIVVTYVSTLVHIYSAGYMHDDPHRQRFMSYLSLFTFCMLMLVTASNFVQLFFGWEGVGLCSYLLIGFWYQKKSACDAALKAFLVNRVGDICFALGIFTIFINFNSLEFSSVFFFAKDFTHQTVNLLGFQVQVITLICILLFLGAMGKSAQLGLHTWLPDAMEGPTPVSALIHAATMVTAGVFLVARCSPLFEYSEVARNLVTIVGAVTAIFAASIALVQNDIKRIVAYSTCSQLGYMFFACGVSAYPAAIFHLATHGFFKALLFLGAGSVIHALSGEQDIRKMGGIWKKIPFSYGMMLIGSLALAGVYPFAGFFSKDAVLEAAYASNSSSFGGVAYILGLIAALFTAFYSWRLIILTFNGESRLSDDVKSHVHESPFSMTAPLAMLAIGAIFSGMVFNKFGIIASDLDFWNGSIFVHKNHTVLEEIHHVPFYVKYAPLIVGILGIIGAYVVYLYKYLDVKQIQEKHVRLYNLLLNKYYFDEVYDFLFVRPTRRVSSFLSKIIDAAVIDGLGPNGLASVSGKAGMMIRKIQTGYVYHYIFVMVVAVCTIISYLIFIR